MLVDTVHTTHGRAVAFATGIKMTRPELTVIVVMGDGDATAIGGNHLIHGARRDIDLTVVIYNNNIYGMTGGQYSPTSPTGSVTSTSAHGFKERPFDIMKLVKSAGASYAARATSYHVDHLTEFIVRGIRNEGFSVVEAVTTCPTYYGRRNSMMTPVDMMMRLRDTYSFRDDHGGGAYDEAADPTHVIGEF
jgi:2-oxoglutarate/2-oxoacid ferredoxin oxidoreductase subunit beta